MIVVNPTMDGQRRGPSVLAVEGPSGVMLPRLIAEAFAGKRPRRTEPTAAQQAAATLAAAMSSPVDVNAEGNVDANVDRDPTDETALDNLVVHDRAPGESPRFD